MGWRVSLSVHLPFAPFYLFLLFSNAKLTVNPPSRTPHTIIDKKRRMLVILAGRPHDHSWMQDVIDPASALLEETRLQGDAADAWTEKQRDARRGDFVAMTTGTSYGGGQEVSLFRFSFSLAFRITNLASAPYPVSRCSQGGQGVPGPLCREASPEQALPAHGWLF